MDIGRLNEEWVSKLIAILTKLGIDYFCCAPGSRSTPLLLAIANQTDAKSSVHFDERAVAFHAVGFAKGARRPAAVVATSGTAVGNLLPAVMEASNERIPLILLTADRPPELRDCGANQTCDQVKLFHNHVRWQVDLACPDEQIEDNYLVSTISHAIAMACGVPAGPVHVNCMFREPLYASHCSKQKVHISPISFSQPELHPSAHTVAEWTRILNIPRKGIILAGSCPDDDSEAIFALAEQLKWPVFADILSPCRRVPHTSLITHFDPLLKLKPQIQVDALIQFGDRFASKILLQWLDKQSVDFFLHVSKHPMRQDPLHRVTHRVQACPRIFIDRLLEGLICHEEDAWCSDWTHWDACCKKEVTDFFVTKKSITEPGLMHEIAHFLPKNWALFLANSMPIRDANQFLHPKNPVFGNRGVSGIDGNIATVAGIAQGLQKPILAVLGDLTLLHDLTSLHYLTKIPYPVILCVVNNSGGGIFSFLPISKRTEAFEKYVAAAHDLSFESAAQLFEIPYFSPQNLIELKDTLNNVTRHPQSCLIEVTTNRLENVKIHQEIMQRLALCLDASNMAIPTTLH